MFNMSASSSIEVSYDGAVKPTLVYSRLNTHCTHPNHYNSCEVVGTTGLPASHLNSCGNKHTIIIKCAGRYSQDWQRDELMTSFVYIQEQRMQ